MLARFVLGALVAGASIVPAMAGQMNAEEAKRFVSGKIFSFTCFDGTRGAGRILEDMGAAGSIQFGGSGPIRNVRLPGNTLQIRGQAVAAMDEIWPFAATERSPLIITVGRNQAAPPPDRILECRFLFDALRAGIDQEGKFTGIFHPGRPNTPAH